MPAYVDKALRRKAHKERKSLNEVVRNALIREASGPDLAERVYTDLDDLAGSWVDVPGFDDAIKDQDQAVPRRRRGVGPPLGGEGRSR